MIPQTVCSSCSHSILSPAKTIQASAGTSKQGLMLEFPLCQPCADLLTALEAVEGTRAQRGCLLSLPIALVGYFAYHLLAGREEISWLLLLASWLLFYLLTYHLFGRWIGSVKMHEDAEAAAKRVRSAVKMSGFSEAHAWTSGGITLEFASEAYAHAFLQANNHKAAQPA
ncbi:MAG: hypothetical protein HYZ26_02055 [Chloroflexi bacterium]|nr:hypothetical protein [Chloroflexota bacterium]